MFVRPSTQIARFASHTKLKKSLGQHFLKSDSILQKIVQRANISFFTILNDIVLEIGPGSGVLTEKLLEKPIQVVAIEKDSSLVPTLQERFRDYINASRLSLVEGDILSSPLPEYTRCVANIPYYISSPLLQRIVIENRIFVDYFLLVQKEFCSKLCINTESSNHDSTFLTVFMQSFFSISSVLDVPPSCFSPPPKVMSTVMHLSPLYCTPTSLPHVQERVKYMEFLKALFSTKNKSLRQSLQRIQPASLDFLPSTIDPVVLQIPPHA